MLVGLDLGTLCGWSLWHAGRLLNSGLWSLADVKPRRLAGSSLATHGRSRYEVFERRLEALVVSHRVDGIAFEDVHAHAGVTAAHVFGGWKAIVGVVAARCSVPVHAVTTGQLRQAAGVAFASKSEIADGDERRKENKRRTVAAAAALGWPVADDNEADAIFVGAVVARRGV